MPGIQEMVNRKRGVTVYNPVRPILPRGIANAGTAGRVMGGGLGDSNVQQRNMGQIGGGGGGGGRYTPPQQQPLQYQPQPLPTYQGFQPQYMPGQLLARVTGGQQPQQQAPDGFLGTLITSGPGKFVMGALNVLDVPRRVVVSGVQEAVDAINGGDASWHDFTEQVQDPSFGFGDIIGDATGNSWVNRFLGFAGDVLLDPLTYVAGAGLISGVGRESRVGLAAASRAAGLGEDIAQRVGRYGVSVLDDAEREVLRRAGVAGVRDAGYYFRVPMSRRIAGEAMDLRIPGTGALERGVSGTFAGVRASLAGTRGATALRRWRSPAGLEDAWRKILTGAGPMPFDEAAALVTFSDADRLARGTFISRLNAESQQMIRDAGNRGLFGTRAGNEALSTMIHTAETEGGTLVNDIFDSALTMLKEVGVNRPGRKNYVPHLLTEGAQDWLRGDTLEARYLRDAFFPGKDLNDVTPSMLERRLVPGANPDKPFIINGKEFYIREGTIKEMNDQFAKLVPDAGFKFFEDDFSQIISRYAHSLSEDVGLVAGVRRLLNSKTNFVRRIGNEVDDVTDDVINDVLNRYGDPEIADRLRVQLKHQSETVQTIRDGLQTGVSDIQGVLAVHASQALDELSTLETSAKTELQDLFHEEAGLAAQSPRGPAGLVGPVEPGEPTALEIALQKQLDRADQKLAKLDAQAQQVMEAAQRQRVDISTAAQKNYPRLKQQWDELNLSRARLHHDRETLAALHDQVQHAREVARRMDAASENPSFLNLALGGDQQRRFRAGTEPDIERRTIREQGERINTEHAVRTEFSRERERVLRNAPTRVQELEASIGVQNGVLARAQQRLDDTFRELEPVMDRAIADRDRELLIHQARQDEMAGMVADPAAYYQYTALSAIDHYHRTQGRLYEAENFVVDVQKPVKAAQSRLDLEQRKLDSLAAQRDEAVKQAAQQQDPIHSTQVQQQLANLNAREAAAVANVRKAEPIYAMKTRRETVAFARERRFTESQYEGSLPQFMETEDRADLINAHRAVREADRTTEAGQKVVRDARETIRRIEAEYAHALTPRQKLMRERSLSAMQEMEERLRKIREIREHPLAFPRKGTPERAALMPPGSKGGDLTTTGRAASALRMAFDELEDLPLAGTPDELNRAILDHDLVTNGLIDSEMVRNLVDKRARLEDVATKYQQLPLPHLRRQIEQLTRDTMRDVEMMGRLRLAQEAGIEVDDRVASFIAHRQLKAENEAIDDQIGRLESALTSPRNAERQVKYELAYNSQINEIRGLRANLDQVNAERAPVLQAVNAGENTHENVTRLRQLNADRESLKKKVRRAEANLYRMAPPSLGIVADDVDMMTYALREQIESVFQAQREVVQAERLARKMTKTTAEQHDYLVAKIPWLKRNEALYTERARRIEAAIAKAEGVGKDEVGYWAYEPSAKGRQFIKMPLDDAREVATKTRTLESAAASQIRNVQNEIDLITGKHQMRIDQIERLLLDQQTPPDINRLRQEAAQLQTKQELTPAQKTRLDFINERIGILERPDPLSMQEIGSLSEQRDYLIKEMDDYAKKFTQDERYAQSILDDGREYFEQLVRGDRPLTRRDQEVLINLFGGDKAEEVSVWVRTLKQALKDHETISMDDLRSVLDELAELHGNAQMSNWLMERAIGAHPDLIVPTAGEALPERATAELTGVERVDRAEVSVNTIRSDIKTALVGAAETERIKRTRELAEFLKFVGFSIGDASDTHTKSILRAMGQDLDAMKRQITITGRKTVSSPIDENSLREFVIKQLEKTGWSRENTIHARIEDLRVAQQRINRMRRGLGSVVQGARVKDENTFFRWLHEIDNITAKETARKSISDAEYFQALLLPPEMEQAFFNRKAALQDDLKHAIATNDASGVDEVMRRLDELEAGARSQGIPVPERQPPPPEAAEELPPALEQPVERPPAQLSEAQRDDLAAERESLEAQLAEVNEDIIVARSEQPTATGAVQDPAADALRKAQQDFDRWFDTVDVDNLSVAQRKQQEDLMNALLQAQEQARRAGLNAQEILAGPQTAIPSKSAVDIGRLTDRRDQIQAQIDDLDQQIRDFGAQGGDPGPPPPPETEGLVPPDQPNPLERPVDITDEQLTMRQIDDEYEQVLSEYDNLKQIANPLDPLAPDELIDQAANLSARARQLRAMKRERMGSMQPPLTPDLLAYQRVKEPARQSVEYNWRSIWKSGAPDLATARALIHSDQDVASRFLRSYVPSKTLGAFPPTGVGMPIRDSLLGQEVAAGIIERERRRLSDAARGQRGRARELANEAQVQRRRIATGEQQVAELEGQVPALQTQRVNETEQQRLEAIGNRRRQVAVDKERAEQAYTKKLTEIDADLAEVRTKLAAAKTEADRAGDARARIDGLLKQPIPSHSEGIEVMLNDLRDLSQNLDGLPPEIASDVAALLDAAVTNSHKLNVGEVTEEMIQDSIDTFARQSDAVANTITRLTADGMREIASDLVTGADSMYIAQQMSTAIRNLQTALKNQSTWKLIGGYTAFFKTYATMRPGFHVRNMMSGMFMNLVDNVQIGNMWRGLREYRKFKRNPQQYWEAASEEMRDAFRAVWGSGAGGQFGEYGVGGAGKFWSKGQHRLMNNFATRMNRRGGEYVEGALRLSMAIDSIQRGQTLEQSLQRITKYHFDYTQVSQLDRTAKQLIPFWTFMSRNLPLQIESMWMRPRTYLQYQSFVRNFAEAADPLTPEYWLAQGAFTMDENAPNEEAPWYLAMDLPHLRVAEPLQAVAQGEMGKALLQDVNPLFLAPYEAFITGEDAYTGRPMEGYEEPTGPMQALMPLLSLLGGTAVGGQSGDTLVDERYAHVARSILPPLDQLERFLDNDGTRAGRQDETIYRALGAPIYQLTPELRESTRRRTFFTKQEQEQRRAELARM